MCGIAGIVSVGGSPIPDGVVERMIATLQRHGPGDSGAWRDNHCSLAHQRLSIIDLSRNSRQLLDHLLTARSTTITSCVALTSGRDARIFYLVLATIAAPWQVHVMFWTLITLSSLLHANFLWRVVLLRTRMDRT